jgi:uncharacterized protein (DUF342 family)
MSRFIKALETKYQAKIDEALATLEIYFNKAVGVGEHPDIIEVLDNYLEMLDENQSKLETLQNLVNQPMEPENNQESKSPQKNRKKT